MSLVYGQRTEHSDLRPLDPNSNGLTCEFIYVNVRRTGGTSGTNLLIMFIVKKMLIVIQISQKLLISLLRNEGCSQIHRKSDEQIFSRFVAANVIQTSKCHQLSQFIHY